MWLPSTASIACSGRHIGRSNHLPHIIWLAFHIHPNDTPSFLCDTVGIELIDYSARSWLCLDWSAKDLPDSSIRLQQLYFLSVHCGARANDWAFWQRI